MDKSFEVIQEATFNPNIKTYVLFVVAFLLLVSVVGIPLLLPWFLGLGQHIAKRYYQNLKCSLTQRHLEFKKGVLFKVEKTIPLENIQDLTFIENPFLNYLGLRILKIETAGSSNPKGSDMKLIGIEEMAHFKDKVLQQREFLAHKITGASQSGQKDGNREILEVLQEIRDLLSDFKKGKQE